MGQVQRRARLKRELQRRARVKVARVSCTFDVLGLRCEIAAEAMARSAAGLGAAFRVGLERATKKVLDETSAS